MSADRRWTAVILAATRGPQDPMAVAYKTDHKCLVEIGGVPMLARVVDALHQSGLMNTISVSIEPSVDLTSVLRPTARVSRCQPQKSAPASALAAADQLNHYPLLVTTGDHALLTPEIVQFFCKAAEQNLADFSAGIASGSVIRAAYPHTKRTYFRFGNDEFSGCNLFAIQSEKGLAVLRRWKDLEQDRKRPWKLVAAFGVRPILMYLTRKLTVKSAFEFVSDKLRLHAAAIWVPFAEAAIDVDKPSDKDLAEKIVAARRP